MKKISIIIPVYNRENTIIRTLNSIIPQLRDDVELIIINDGSTDRSNQVIEEYIRKQPREILYFSKENEGVAATRNFGIQKANGKYILFVDSDDYLADDFMEVLADYLEKDYDLIKFKIRCVDEKKRLLQQVEGPIFSSIPGKEAFNMLAFSDVLMDSPCTYLFKKDLFIKNNLFFKAGTEHEDFGLIPLILLTAESVISINFYGYYYVQTENSITRNEDYQKTIKKFEDTLLHYDNMLELLGKFSISHKTKQNVKTYYTNAILLKLKTIKKEDRKKYIKKIQEREMLKNIQVGNLRQFFKKIILSVNINWYLRLV